jgi:uncharacterized membrane protein YraQ (UPF0718 family)
MRVCAISLRAGGMTMDFILNLVAQSVRQVLLTLLHNWPFLLASILIAALMQVFVDVRKVSAFLGRHRRAGVAAATAAAVATPFCSCGTTAVVLGMMASTMPWAPIVAFMVASPLSSPEGMVYTAGLFGWPFALTSFLFSILLGLSGGFIAASFERRGWLDHQARFAAVRPPASACACASLSSAEVVRPPEAACACSQPSFPVFPVREIPARGTAGLQLAACCAGGVAVEAAATRVTETALVKALARVSGLPKEIWNIGKRLLPMFLGFAFIGYLLNGLVPAAWVNALFGSGNVYGVPLAATLGLPLYISEGSLPLIRALMDSGMSQGAVMAFLIAGSGTSMGAIAGALTIARWRVVGLVVGVLWIGAMCAGFAYDTLLALKVF